MNAVVRIVLRFSNHKIGTSSNRHGTLMIKASRSFSEKVSEEIVMEEACGVGHAGLNRPRTIFENVRASVRRKCRVDIAVGTKIFQSELCKARKV